MTSRRDFSRMLALSGGSLLARDALAFNIPFAMWQASATPAPTTKGLYFDGTGYLTFNDASLPSGSNGRSISLWVNAIPSSPSIQMFFHYGTASGSGDNGMYYYSGRTGTNLGTSVAGVSTGSAIITNKYHIVATLPNGSSTWTIYVNGTSQGTVSLSVNTVLNSGIIGCDLSLSYGMVGNMTDIRVYNGPITQSEVTALYNSGTFDANTNPVTSYSIVGWWKCQEGSGTTVADSSGNGHTATMNAHGINWITF